MDDMTFDRITRTLGTDETRRGALRAATALGAALLGARAVVGEAEELVPEGNRCKGKNCNKDKNCGKGLICNLNGKCEYKKGKKGKKGDTCCKNKECKKGLDCKNSTCKRK